MTTDHVGCFSSWQRLGKSNGSHKLLLWMCQAFCLFLQCVVLPVDFDFTVSEPREFQSDALLHEVWLKGHKQVWINNLCPAGYTCPLTRDQWLHLANISTTGCVFTLICGQITSRHLYAVSQAKTCTNNHQQEFKCKRVAMSQHNTGFTDRNREQKSLTIKRNIIGNKSSVEKSIALEIWLLQNQTDVMMIHKLIAL